MRPFSRKHRTSNVVSNEGSVGFVVRGLGTVEIEERSGVVVVLGGTVIVVVDGGTLIVVVCGGTVVVVVDGGSVAVVDGTVVSLLVVDCVVVVPSEEVSGTVDVVGVVCVTVVVVAGKVVVVCGIVGSGGGLHVGSVLVTGG